MMVYGYYVQYVTEQEFGMDKAKLTCCGGICICCEGEGIQIRNDGIKILCPACEGTGLTKPTTSIFEYDPIDIPYYQPYPYRYDNTGSPFIDETVITC